MSPSLAPISAKAFAAYQSEGYLRIPVARTILADLETPLTAYLKLAQGPYSYLFESVQGGEKWGRFSIIGLPCAHRLIVRGGELSEHRDENCIRAWQAQDPLAEVDRFRERFSCAPVEGLPVFHGGLVGYFGYDTVRFVESRLANSMPADDIGNPDILLMVSEEVLVFDNLAGTLTLVVNADAELDGAYEAAIDRLDVLEKALPETFPKLAKYSSQSR